VLDVTAPPREALRPNWWAIAALSLVVASWLALALRILTGEILAIDSALDWLYLGAVAGAVAAGAAGLIAIHWRGDAWLAVSAFFASLILPAGYAFLYAIGVIVFGDDPGTDDFVD
jgi:hypothetical protein